MKRRVLLTLCVALMLISCSPKEPMSTVTPTAVLPQATVRPSPSATVVSEAPIWNETKLPAGCRFSSLSSDRNWVIYLCKDKLWLAQTTDMSNATLVLQDDYIRATSWSPDGTEFAVGTGHLDHQNKYIAELWAAKPQAPLRRRLLHRGGFDCDLQLWSPSGKWILAAGGGGKSSDAILVRTDGTGQEALAPIGIMSWWQSASWSPDSTHLAYASDEKLGEVKALDVDTGVTTLIYTSTESILVPAWSPDGKMIAILAQSYPGKLAVVDSASKRVLNDLTLPASWKQSHDLFWSPDSNRMAIQFFLDRHQIGIVSLSGGEMSELAGEELWPVLGWSKDGLVGFDEEGDQETIQIVPVK